MGRWTQYEEDSERLPTGMKRIGYDADTRVYTFQDENGVLYESEPGNAYGILRPVVRDYERDIRRARPNAFESPRKSSSNHSRSSSTPTSNLHSFQQFLPPTAITSPPNTPTRNTTNDSPLPTVFSKVKSMTSIVSRLQLSNKHPEGGRYQHIKSPSLPASSLSTFHQSSERYQPSLPQTPSALSSSSSKKNREYSMSRKEVEGEEEELKKRLFRSKTSVTRPKPSSPALGSRSPSPSMSSSSGSEHYSLPPPPVPPKKNRDYTSSRKGAEEDELRKGLLRSKTSVTKSSALTPSSTSTPGSKYRSPAHHPTSFSPPPPSSYPKRTTSQASRISSISTTSTITPMKTT